MPTSPYDDIRKLAQHLSPEQLEALGEELLLQASRKEAGERPTLMDLEGLGKDVWEGVDADEYVARERDSWDG